MLLSPQHRLLGALSIFQPHTHVEAGEHAWRGRRGQSHLREGGPEQPGEGEGALGRQSAPCSPLPWVASTAPPSLPLPSHTSWMTFDWDREQTKPGIAVWVGCLAWSCFLRGRQPVVVAGREGPCAQPSPGRGNRPRMGQRRKEMEGWRQPPEEMRGGLRRARGAFAAGPDGSEGAGLQSQGWENLGQGCVKERTLPCP